MDSQSLIGKKVGNYVVKSLLCEGGMGTVYLAEHPEIGRRVALKVIIPGLARDKEVVKRFLAEARAVARIDHPNIVDIYDFGHTDDDQLYCTMELLKGKELQAVIAQRDRFSAEEVVPYLDQICVALHAAHQTGVVHRDLKPDNIYVLDREQLTL